MKFEERKFVIANLVEKTDTNVIGVDNIIAVRFCKNRVYDFHNKQILPIIYDDKPMLELKNGYYVKILVNNISTSREKIDISDFPYEKFEPLLNRIENKQVMASDYASCGEISYEKPPRNNKRKWFKLF